MKRPDFSTFAPLNLLKAKMGIPAAEIAQQSDELPIETFYPMPPRAVVMFRSGAKLDLLDPQPDCWTDEDLAQNLARIARWIEQRVRGFRRHHEIAGYRDGEWSERGEITLEATAEIIGVCKMTALRMIERGDIKGRQPCPEALKPTTSPHSRQRRHRNGR